MATYNGEKFIKEQLISILKQISKDDEIIISDDGSTDRTISIINDMKDPRIKVYINNGKHGVSFNFVNALEKASGEYIFLADQDDYWLPNKYCVIMEYLKEFDLIHSDSIVTDENLNVLNDSFYAMLRNGKGIIKNIIKSTYYGSHMAFSREIFLNAMPFPKTTEIGHDLWLGLVAETIGKVAFINEKLLYYRRHEEAYCQNCVVNKRSILKKMLGRLIILRYIIHFYIKRRLKI